MRIVMFYHSLVSDWNHGNAHFLRGVARELQHRGHEVRIFEPADGWSRSHLEADHGPQIVDDFHRVYPDLRSTPYALDALDLDETLAGADLVIVHEWNSPDLIARIGQHRATAGYTLFFHDTHHRSVTDPAAIEAFDLRRYDGVLAFGDRIRDRYLQRRWTARAWTWHEAADTTVFQPRASRAIGDLVWIGNWGDEERSAELEEFLIEPVRRLHLRAVIYGVRYPPTVIARLADAGIEYRGWLPNYRVPDVFARYAVTVHVPRKVYREMLPGIPTIRPFEALACGIPLVCAAWSDAGGVFVPGRDFLVARDGLEMTAVLGLLTRHPHRRKALARRGLTTVRRGHTCAHRVNELMALVGQVARERVTIA